ncbi:MAG: lysophospholipid acyltransferase family protein, partial [Pseudomonadota bacterium]
MKSWTHGAMTLIRSSLFFVLFVLNTLVFGLILSILGWFLPAGWKEALSNTWAIVTIAALKATCGLGYRVRGRENIPREPRIIMSKHQSAWETMALRAIFRGSQSWVLKRELMWVPVFGWALATMSPIAIDRKTGR